jgi:hypothetical protein
LKTRPTYHHLQPSPDSPRISHGADVLQRDENGLLYRILSVGTESRDADRSREQKRSVPLEQNAERRRIPAPGASEKFDVGWSWLVPCRVSHGTMMHQIARKFAREDVLQGDTARLRSMHRSLSTPPR